MINTLLKILFFPFKLFKFDLFFFKIYWKNKNKLNKTFPVNIFPSQIVSIGKGTYGPLNILTWGSSGEKLEIGNFVSIASGCKFILGGNHNTKSITTYPTRVMCWGEKIEATTKGSIIIEDDVWIGTDVLLLSGIKIGKGAVIAAGSVVTKSVEPYSIVGGNPAKVIKDRVPQMYKDRLLKLDLNKLMSLDRNLIEEYLYSDLTEGTLLKIEELLRNN